MGQSNIIQRLPWHWQLGETLYILLCLLLGPPEEEKESYQELAYEFPTHLHC